MFTWQLKFLDKYLKLSGESLLVGRAVVHDGAVGPDSEAGVAGQGGDGEEVRVLLLQGLLFHVAQDVDHDHAALKSEPLQLFEK